MAKYSGMGVLAIALLSTLPTVTLSQAPDPRINVIPADSKAEIDQSLVASFSCKYKDGEPLTSGHGVRVLSALGEEDQIEQIMVVDSRGCHIILPGKTARIALMPDFIDYSAYGFERPRYYERMYEFENRLVELILAEAVQKCQNENSVQLDKYNAGTKFAFCIERAVTRGVKRVTLVEVFGLVPGRQVENIVFVYRGKLFGVSKSVWHEGTEKYDEYEAAIEGLRNG